MRLFNICTKREFEKEGERKVKWYKAGILKISDNGNTFIRLFHQPMTDFHVFESAQLSPEPKAEN